MMTKILIIDDDAYIRQQLKRLLELDDYDTYTAEDGQKGLEIFDQEKPQIALVDISMPGIDGIEVLKRIKEKLEEAEVIIITGRGGIDSAIEAMREGAFSYIQKPIEYDELEIDIKRALEKQEMRRKLNEYVHNLEQAVEEKNREITQRKQVEEQLRYQAHLLENVSDAVISTNMDFVIQSWNKAAESMYGWKADEVLGKPLEEVEKPEYTGDTREVVIQKFIENGYYEGEAIHHQKDGTPITVWGKVSMIKDSSGKPVGSVSVNRDITERRLVEEELRKTNRRLSETLAELEATQQQVIQQERLRALGQMASGVAHDFNNALTPILGYTELLFRTPQTLDDKEKTMSYLKMMNTTAKDASSVVMRLREFYREREEDEIFVPVNFNRLVKQTIELTATRWKDQAQSNGITISLRTALQRVPLINGNESELRNMLTNLIFNAVDAMPKSGTITIRTSLDNDFVVLEVSDTGTGMTAEVKQRCFEPFFSTKEEGGTGLGLSMVHGIIRRHEGMIKIDSEPGEGTTVIIRLPIRIEEQAEDEGQEAGVITRSLNILLVDDKPEVRDVITRYLRVDGHRVETAKNGREGLEAFYKGRFDLVITDRAMPDINGIELATLIKEIAPNKPIIMLTGFGDMMRVTGDIPASIDYLLNKPVMLNDFREALAKVMAG